MNISLSELKTFNNIASSLKGSNTFPVLDYVKFGNGKIIKTVMSSFVQFDCKDADTEMLVDEKLLSVKIGNAQSDFFNFSKKGIKVTLTDSVTPTTFQVPDSETFPLIPEPTSERFAISENFMRVLNKAKHFSLTPDSNNLSWMSFIMVGNGYICATGGHSLFTESIEERFELVLDKNHAHIISKLPIKEYAFAEKYMFFYGDGFAIGFSRQEIGYSNIISYGEIKSTSAEFIASGVDIEKFNKECIQSSKFLRVSMNKGKLSLNDPNRDIQLEKAIQGIQPSEQFTYNPEIMNRIISAIDGDDIEFYKGKDCYWLKSPPQKSTLLIMRIMD